MVSEFVTRTNEDLISVIVPVYNVEKYLETCVNSIRSQTYSNLEIILVDDGSPDQSGAICDRLASEDDRIRVIHKQNEGLGLTRNAGMAAASGRWLMFVDSDDWIDETMAEKLLDAIQRNGADFVRCGWERFYPDGSTKRFLECQQEQVFDGRDAVLENILLPLMGSDLTNSGKPQRSSVSAWLGLYSAERIKEANVKFLSEKIYLSEDTIFNMKYVLSCQKVVRIPVCLYHYRSNPASLTSSFRKNRILQTQVLYQFMQEFVDAEGLRSLVGWRMERSYMLHLRHALMLAIGAPLRRDEKKAYYKEAVNNDTTQTIAAAYPQQGIPIRERIMVMLMRQKKAGLLYYYLNAQRYLVYIRNRINPN